MRTRPRVAATETRVTSWSDGSSGSRTSTASPPRPRASARSPPTRSPATSSARSSPGAVRATSSSPTARASTSTSAATPSTPPPSATRCARLVAHDRAGERVVEGLVADAQARLREDGVNGEIYVFKNNTDSAGNSYGCHENYLVGRAGDFQVFSDTLLPFLISRQITCGAGRLVRTSKGVEYAVSQRADHIWEGVSSATTRSRPIINTRDEPHADAEQYRRLHVIVGDSNMSETTTMLKVGSCDLVLRMIEDGVVMRDLTLENPIRAIREISHDMTGRRLVRLANGREAQRPRPAARVPRRRGGIRRARGRTRPRPQDGPRPVGAHARRRRDRQPRHRRHRDRLDHQVQAARRLRDPARARPRLTAAGADRPRLPRHHAAARAVLPAPGARPGGTRRHRPGDLRGQGQAAADDPGQPARRLHPGGAGAPARLHRRLGAPQGSTTRRSAPSCARTRSATRTRGCNGSSRACERGCDPRGELRDLTGPVVMVGRTPPPLDLRSSAVSRARFAPFAAALTVGAVALVGCGDAGRLRRLR